MTLLLSGLWTKLLAGLAVLATIGVSLAAIMRGARRDGERDERLRQREQADADRARVDDVLSRTGGSTGEVVDRYRKGGRL